MEKRILSPLILFLFFSAALAADWDQRFTEVCKYDEFCRRLKTSDGTWLRPKPEVVAILKDKDIQSQIRNAAAQYGVDATALAGAILAENSLNVGLKDAVQTWLAKKAGITAIGTHEFTFGFGQIGINAAMEADQHLAKVEGRNPKSRDELVAEITSPAGSIRIAATVLRKVQDDYKDEGFDISKDPALLTTLYNLGRSSVKAKEAKAAGRTPRSNYFGLFVDKYASEIRKVAGIAAPAAPVAAAAIGTSSPQKTIPPTASGDAPAVPILSTEATKRPGGVTNRAPAKVVAAKKVEMTTADALAVSIPLVSQPMQCRSSDYGQDPEREAKSTNYGAPIGVMDAGAVYTEISRALDCKSNIWKLIKDEKGMSGWIQEDRLEKATIKKLVPVMSCKPSDEQQKCIAAIRSKVGDLAISDDLENGLLFLKPVSAPNSEEPSFADEDRQCGFNPELDREKSGARNQQNMAWGVRPKVVAKKISIPELKKKAKASLDFLRDEFKRMASSVGIELEELEDADNPYQRVFQLMHNFERDSSTMLSIDPFRKNQLP